MGHPARRLRELRKKHQHSQEWLASQIGCTQTIISMVEREDYTHLGTEKWQAIGRIYGKTPVYIIGGVRLRCGEKKYYPIGAC